MATTSVVTSSVIIPISDAPFTTVSISLSTITLAATSSTTHSTTHSTTTSNPTATPTTTSTTNPTTSSSPVSLSGNPSVQTPATSKTGSGTTAPASTASDAVGSPPRKVGVSSSAVAGAVVGAALAVALITFLLTFLIMRRRSKGESGKRHRSGRKRHGGTGKEGVNGDDTGWTPEGTFEPAAKSNGLVNLDNYLPQSADDRTIQGRASTLFEQIQLHVENYYHNLPVSVSESDAAAAIAPFGSPYLPGNLISLLSEPRSRIPAIKHCFAHKIISSITPDSGSGSSFLPHQFAMLPGTLDVTDGPRSGKPGFDAALSRWKVLTAYLLPNPNEDDRYTSDRDSAINDVAHALSRAFAPWASTAHPEQDRIYGLAAILKSAADFGILILSQPSWFEYRWDMAKVADPQAIVVAILVAPAVVKVTDEQGRRLRVPQVVVEAVA